MMNDATKKKVLARIRRVRHLAAAADSTWTGSRPQHTRRCAVMHPTINNMAGGQ